MTTTLESTFVNTAQRRELDPKWDGPDTYGFNQVPMLLFVWSGLFQKVISQAGSFIAEGKFHERECGIYKCEGGCKISGWGDLVLLSRRAYNDYGRGDKKDKVLPKLVNLITTVVLEWNPLEPIDSMLASASKVAGCKVEDLRAALEKNGSGGPFGGNALSEFFNWNPFSEAPINEAYEKWCLVTICKSPEAEVDQMQYDRAQGKEYLKQMIELCRKNGTNGYSAPMCCSPRRREDGTLGFWINTGSRTQIDGWKSEDDIKEFLKSDGKLVKVQN